MASHCTYRARLFYLMLFAIAGASFSFAGVSRVIQEQYKKDYENKAMYLKIPIYLEKQIIQISGQNYRIGPGSGTPKLKVADQVRILQVEFSGEEIKFKLGGITAAAAVEIEFKFDSNLQESFPNKDVFDLALQAVFTEGIKYTEIDEAKRAFVETQFGHSIREIADAASLNRDTVLKSVAPLIPAYQDAQRNIENLKSKVQDISGQLAQSQSENRKHESELKTLQSELARVKSAQATLQEKADGSVAQVAKLGEELRDARTAAQGYQKELANIQRSLNVRTDANRDLSQQVADLGQAMRKLQKENDSLLQQVGSLQAGLEAQKAANARLTKDNEDLKAGNQRMQKTIDTLTSNKASIQNQYLQLSDFAQSLKLLRARIEEEKTEGGVYSGKANVYLKGTLLGSLTWSIPTHLNFNESKPAEATFYAASIESIKTTAEEKHFLSTFGDRLKIRLEMSSDSAAMTVTPEREPPHEIGERDRSTWHWVINNRQGQDSRILLAARLINRNSNEIPLFQQDRMLLASNAVREVRNYLHAGSLAIGAAIGFLLFGIVGIFRRRKPPQVPPRPSVEPTQPISYDQKKQL
jgi:predicted nuclease with TOPRIM domain